MSIARCCAVANRPSPSSRSKSDGRRPSQIASLRRSSHLQRPSPPGYPIRRQLGQPRPCRHPSPAGRPPCRRRAIWNGRPPNRKRAISRIAGPPSPHVRRPPRRPPPLLRVRPLQRQQARRCPYAPWDSPPVRSPCGLETRPISRRSNGVRANSEYGGGLPNVYSRRPWGRYVPDIGSVPAAKTLLLGRRLVRMRAGIERNPGEPADHAPTT